MRRNLAEDNVVESIPGLKNKIKDNVMKKIVNVIIIIIALQFEIYYERLIEWVEVMKIYEEKILVLQLWIESNQQILMWWTT